MQSRRAASVTLASRWPGAASGPLRRLRAVGIGRTSDGTPSPRGVQAANHGLAMSGGTADRPPLLQSVLSY
ncbi:hypothetical protein I553_4756 [Mycobacterium xenopi 4042]|uniref:Uncharacterized protein n=1 Tax=Mycobacterium xenopi 4042 TaxID=1299334 RepID=X8AG06_MYCXE|nr:hypothetical protein I553_4756 [Mycobacterium xenopi 4042]